MNESIDLSTPRIVSKLRPDLVGRQAPRMSMKYISRGMTSSSWFRKTAPTIRSTTYCGSSAGSKAEQPENIPVFMNQGHTTVVLIFP